MSTTKNDVLTNVMNIGLRMYGNGSIYSKESVNLVSEFCRRAIREYFLEHQQLTTKEKKKSVNRMLYIHTLVYRLRKKQIGLKRLEQYLQAKDRPSTQDDQVVKEKKLTLHDRFYRITRQLRLDHQLVDQKFI